MPAEPLRSLSLPLSVYTVNYPLQYFAESIGGEFVAAKYPGSPDEDPAFWKPGVDTVVDYQQADLIILNGVGYAGWVKQVSLPLSKQVDASAAFMDQLLPVADKVAHTHGPTGDHVHDDLAFTVWLDPELAGLQATAIHSALAPLLPEQIQLLDENLSVLIEELQMLDKALADAFSLRSDRQVIYSHPVYQYLDRRYALDGLSVHWEPNETPAEDEFRQLTGMAGAVMLWEAEPLPAVKTRLAEMGISSVVFSIGATRPDNGDYLDLMRENTKRINNTLR